MRDHISFVKQTLSESIKEMSTVPWLFVKNPESDFSRKRKLDFDTFFHFFISMEGRSLGTELLD
ncbi:hypothetical protein SAMN02745691_02377, partial [Parasporobacterium paucivorans DSM 15970]